jgi:hypothetical protein
MTLPPLYHKLPKTKSFLYVQEKQGDHQQVQVCMRNRITPKDVEMGCPTMPLKSRRWTPESACRM